MSAFVVSATATTEIYTLSLHDALPISEQYQLFGADIAGGLGLAREGAAAEAADSGVKLRHAHLEPGMRVGDREDRKSTRLNSSHLGISYAVFCLKKKKNTAGSFVL